MKTSESAHQDQWFGQCCVIVVGFWGFSLSRPNLFFVFLIFQAKKKKKIVLNQTFAFPHLSKKAKRNGGKGDNRVLFCCRCTADFIARIGMGQTGCPVPLF